MKNISIVTSAFAAVVLSFGSASAQAVGECKPEETQPECHARLKCKPDEELEDCKKRVKNAAKGGNNNQQGNDNRGNNRGNDRDDPRDRDNGRGNDRYNDDDRGRGRDNDRGRGRGRDNDRYDDDGGGDRGRGRSRRSRGRRGGGGFQSNKTFGLGLELGEPSGLNGKYFLSDSGALDFGVGWIYSHYYYGDGVHLYGDYLFHPTTLTSTNAFELPFYIGVGLRYWDFDYCVRRSGRFCDFEVGGSAIGVRVPVGISFDFNNNPLDIFVQLVPVLDFVNGDYYDEYRDRSHFGIDFSVGIRYWFF